MGDEERRMRYKIEAKEWETQGPAMMRRRQERDIKLKLQKKGNTSAKRTKREVFLCAGGRKRDGANGIKIKVIELPETQIYTDSIDHRLKQ